MKKKRKNTLLIYYELYIMKFWLKENKDHSIDANADK